MGGVGENRPAEDATLLLGRLAGGKAEAGDVGVEADRPADDVRRDDALRERGAGDFGAEQRGEVERALAVARDDDRLVLRLRGEEGVERLLDVAIGRR